MALQIVRNNPPIPVSLPQHKLVIGSFYRRTDRVATSGDVYFHGIGHGGSHLTQNLVTGKYTNSGTFVEVDVVMSISDTVS